MDGSLLSPRWTQRRVGGLVHRPAGATTHIVSLGILREPWQPAVPMCDVVLLTVQGLVINRLAGIDYPVWRADAPYVRGRTP